MSSFTIKQAREALAIDKNSLDEEMVRHPTLLAEVGKNQAMANAIRDTCKDRMEEQEAISYLQSKEQADPKSKPTDYSIKAEAKISKKVLKLLGEYRDAKKKAAVWDTVWTAFMQRSFMLNKLAELYTAQFYSSDSYVRPEYDRKKPEKSKLKRKGR